MKRRGIQITLGLLWILDSGLQFQPAMLTSKFATQVIAPAGDGQPAFVGWPVHQAADLIGRQPALADVAFGLIQLALGAGLSKIAGKVFRIGHLGDFNELMLAGTLAGVEMALAVAGVPHRKGGINAALEYLVETKK